jgi:hypothetical protein
MARSSVLEGGSMLGTDSTFLADISTFSTAFEQIRRYKQSEAEQAVRIQAPPSIDTSSAMASGKPVAKYGKEDRGTFRFQKSRRAEASWSPARLTSNHSLACIAI